MIPGKFSLHRPQPWSILPHALAELEHRVASFVPRSETEIERMISVLEGELELWSDGKTGIVVQKVAGVIRHGASPLEEAIYGLFNLERVDDVIEAARDEPEVRALVLNIDSPGGSVLGVDETCERLIALKADRPDIHVLSYISGEGASAGYQLAAATDEIHASPAAIVGGIGTRALAYDCSGMFGKAGVEVLDFKHGKLKTMGVQGKSWTDEEKDHMRKNVEYFGERFHALVKSRRPGITDDEMQGQPFYGSQARVGPGMMLDSREFRSFGEFYVNLARALQRPA